MRSIFVATTIIAAFLAAVFGDAGQLLPGAQLAGTGIAPTIGGLVPESPSTLAQFGSALLFVVFVIWRKSRVTP